MTGVRSPAGSLLLTIGSFMRLRNTLVFSPLIVGLTLGCSGCDSPKPTAPATPGVTTSTGKNASGKPSAKKVTRQMGPEGVVE
jgi:hypothetical protein